MEIPAVGAENMVKIVMVPYDERPVGKPLEGARTVDAPIAPATITSTVNVNSSLLPFLMNQSPPLPACEQQMSNPEIARYVQKFNGAANHAIVVWLRFSIPYVLRFIAARILN
jgi:hypothetical protein